MLLCGFPACAFRAADRGCQPAPGLPCSLLDKRVERPSKARAKCAARMRRRVCAAGWVEPLRNPSSFRADASMMGFASLYSSHERYSQGRSWRQRAQLDDGVDRVVIAALAMPVLKQLR